MSGETEENVSGWTVDTLKEYFDAQIKQLSEVLDERDARYSQLASLQRDAMQAALAATQKAIDKADIADNKRFDSVNEFRGQLQDLVTTFMPRAESLALHRRAQEDIAELKERAWSMQGASKGAFDQRAISNAGLGLLIGAAALVISVVVIVVNVLVGG